MYRVKIDLSNRKSLDFTAKYVWDLDVKLNDTRTPFVEIEGYIIKKDDIVLVQREELKEDKEEKKVEEEF